MQIFVRHCLHKGCNLVVTQFLSGDVKFGDVLDLVVDLQRLKSVFEMINLRCCQLSVQFFHAVVNVSISACGIEHVLSRDFSQFWCGGG
ncbi:hypothetical protein ASE08_15795 [Rhizobacter sp. Root16D2]|nr:hypothetical protein ASE08_15795 [Rhizobacter sp. Root16D2]